MYYILYPMYDVLYTICHAWLCYVLWCDVTLCYLIVYDLLRFRGLGKDFDFIYVVPHYVS